jgi:hypothetical protein
MFFLTKNELITDKFGNLNIACTTENNHRQEGDHRPLILWKLEVHTDHHGRPETEQKRICDTTKL